MEAYTISQFIDCLLTIENFSIAYKTLHFADFIKHFENPPMSENAHNLTNYQKI